MSAHISYDRWQQLSESQKSNLTLMRLLRDHLAEEIYTRQSCGDDELDAELQKQIEDVCQGWYAHRAYAKLIQSAAKYRRDYDPESEHEKLVKFFRAVAEHVGELERQRIQHPILCPA